MSKSARRPVYRVADRNGLAQLIQDVVDREHHGVVSRAARALAGASTDATHRRVSKHQKRSAARIQRCLSRLVNAELERITDPTYQLIGQLIPKKRYADLRRFVLSEGAQLAYRLYGSWADRSLAQSEWRPGSGHLLYGDDTPLLFAQRQEDLRSYLRAAFPGVCGRLDEALLRRGHSQTRGELAWDRVLAPLLCHLPSGGIERGWDELTESELRRFLEAGIAREEVLLDRASDLERAQRSGAILEVLHPEVLKRQAG